ncbi:MAG: T9SS type A sorting domain-containing protein [Bacteroidota bacterium]|nr:T9SS type A sorting domain-containing protein [Bacteroidota bacterium]
MKNLIIILTALLISLNTFAQTNYFVDDINGNDLNNGTSLATAWKTIQKACNAATPNSIVQIKAGTYNENIVVNISGTPGNSITLKNYLNDVVLIDGTGTSGTAMLSVTDKNYLNFQNLTIQNLTVNDAQGILIETTGINSSTELSFKNITIKNINWTSNPLTIPTSSNNAQSFIAYGGDGGITNIMIDSCKVFNNILGFSEAMTLDGNVDGFTIKNCEVHDNTNIGIDIAGNYQVSSNPTTDHARNGLLFNNTCYKNVSLAATSAGIYVDGGQNVLIEKNKCYENGNGIEIGCEENGTTNTIIVKNNLIYNNQEVGIYVGGYTTSTSGQVLDCIIRNNTLFKNNSLNDGTGEMNISKASNCVFENNIFYTNNQDILFSVDPISPQTNNVFNYNCWFTPTNDPNNITVNWRTSTYATFADYQTGISDEANSIYNDPDLVNPVLPAPDLHLLTASPCINSGNPGTVISTGELDFYGDERIIGSNIDIGASEFDVTTSLKNVNENKDQFSVYPNPFASETTISFNTELKNAELKIFNIFGQEIKEQNFKLKNVQRITIKRNDLISGLYFYTITEENRPIAKGKLIVE